MIQCENEAGPSRPKLSGAQTRLCTCADVAPQARAPARSDQAMPIAWRMAWTACSQLLGVAARRSASLWRRSCWCAACRGRLLRAPRAVNHPGGLCCIILRSLEVFTYVAQCAEAASTLFGAHCLLTQGGWLLGYVVRKQGTGSTSRGAPMAYRWHSGPPFPFITKSWGKPSTGVRCSLGRAAGAVGAAAGGSSGSRCAPPS